MLRKLTDEERLKNVSRVVRCLRKMQGLGQTELAKTLGVSQSNISKIEHGINEPTALFLIDLCELTGAQLIFFQRGFIDNNQNAFMQKSLRDVGKFKIPSVYGNLAGSKIKTSYPFTAYFKHAFGEDGLNKYLEHQDVDPDYIYCQDNQINCNFSFDLIETLIQKGKLNERNVKDVAFFSTDPNAHGSTLDSSYRKQKDQLSLVRTYIKNQIKYSCSYHFDIQEEESSFLDIAVRPHDEMKFHMSKRDDFVGNFLNLYIMEHFKKITTYNNQKEAEVSYLEKLTDKGQGQCILRIKTEQRAI